MSNGKRTVVDAHAAVDALTPTHTQCRDFGHAWRAWDAYYDNDLRCYVERLRCPRCRTVRERLINNAGEQLRSSYEYADGYLLKGVGRLTGEYRDQIRLNSVLHLIETGVQR